MNKRSEVQKKYDDQNTKRYGIKLNLKNDSDIIDRLGKVQSIQGYIKALIREDIKRVT